MFEKFHKMAGWKAWLKGVMDAWPVGQNLLFYPVSVREWCAHSGMAADQARLHLIVRGGFPKPCLVGRPDDAQLWRRQYAPDPLRVFPSQTSWSILAALPGIWGIIQSRSQE